MAHTNGDGSDYTTLLHYVREHAPYNDWQDTGQECFRDYHDDDNPHLQLSRFGLYDFRCNKIVKTLPALARELGAGAELIPATDNGSSARKTKRRTLLLSPGAEELKFVGTDDQKKAQARILKALADKSAWKRDHAPLILRYFEEQRGIPSEYVPLRMYWQLGCTVQTFTPKKGEKSGKGQTAARTEIVVPLWARDGGLVQLLKIEIDKDSAQKIGKGKRLLFHADRDRAIMFGAVKSDRVLIVEGLEDALSLYAALEWQGREEEKREVGAGCQFALCVSCGASGFSKVWELVKDYDQRIILFDPDNAGGRDRAEGVGGVDNDPASDSIRNSLLLAPGPLASVCLGDSVLRYLPDTEFAADKRVGKAPDPNAVLQARGVGAVWEYLSHASRPGRFVRCSEITEARDRVDDAEDNDAGRDPFSWHQKHNPLSEQAAAAYFRDKHGAETRISEDKQIWGFQASVGAWNQDGEAQTFEHIAALHSTYTRLAKTAKSRGKSDEEAAEILKFADSLGSYRKQQNILGTVKNISSLHCRVDDFDAAPHLLNTPSGIVDLRTGTLSPHNPKCMCSKQTAVGFRPELMEVVAEGEEGGVDSMWGRFLEHVSGGNEDWKRHFQTALGYSLTGEVREKCLFFAWGLPDSGKTTFSEIMLHLLGSPSGSGYANACDIKMFTDTDSPATMNAMDYKRASARGSRLLFTSETKSKHKISPNVVKDLTGGDRLTGRFPGGKPFSYKLNAKFWIRGNNPPTLSDADEAVFNRLKIIPFLFPFQGAELDQGFLSRFLGSTRELELALAWCVAGSIAWYRDGLFPFESEAVDDLRADYQQETSDAIVDRFIDECCVRQEGMSTKALDCWAAFRDFVEPQQLETTPGRRDFLIAIRSKLVKKGFPNIKHGNVSKYGNLVLVDPDLSEINTSENDDSDDLFH